MRTIDEIKELLYESKDRVIELHNGINDDVLAEPELAELTSSSKSSIWRLWTFIAAVNIWLHEYSWLLFRIEVEGIVSKSIPNTANWLRDNMYDFQYGHNLLFDNYVPYYEVVDVDAQIVNQAAVVETNTGLVLIKAAKGDGSNGLMPLSSLELQALTFYVESIKPVGTITQVLSLNPDLLKVYADIYYDPQFILGDLQIKVEQAIFNYISSLDFNGRLFLSKIVDAIQVIDGIKDVRLVSVSAKTGINNYQEITNNVAPFKPTYTAVAGYMIIAPDFPLTNTIAYYPDL